MATRAQEYPFFLGYDRRARDAAPGKASIATTRFPGVPPFPVWAEALDDACARIADFGPDILVVSLGVDTFKDDPISKFRLESEDFLAYGRRIAHLGLPTLFVMEGGYAVEADRHQHRQCAAGIRGGLTGRETKASGRSGVHAIGRRRVGHDNGDR